MYVYTHTLAHTGIVSLRCMCSFSSERRVKLCFGNEEKRCGVRSFLVGNKSQLFDLSIALPVSMGERVADLRNQNIAQQAWSISVHTLCDLSHVPPVVFLYLLKECYACGTCKATKKFHALHQQVYQVLHNNPQPGAAIFVAHCLYILPAFGSYCDGFSHLLISSLRRFLRTGTTKEDLAEAQVLAAKLFLDIIRGRLMHEENIVTKILHVFGVGYTDIEKVMHDLDKSDSSYGKAKELVELYINSLIEAHSYMNAVTLLDHFSICHFGESFLCRIMEHKQYRAAEKWAIFMGKPMLCLLVQEYVDRNLLSQAYETIKKNNLQHEFPEVCHQCKESSLKKLAERGCWDIAEARTNNDKGLLEYLVYLAMEAGYVEKVEELCDRHSLEGFMDVKASKTSIVRGHYLSLKELCVEEIVWVDEIICLHDATCHIEECKIVGIDCEWKPNYKKGQQNKVSIMQIASGNKVYILDLIKLYDNVPDTLDDCLTRILLSPSILKLGYSFKCDVQQLANSYDKLQCFKRFDMVLDIQNVFKEPRGGLSGLAEKILGAGLNKTRRNSNWEQRPLSQYQLEYAALDAAVLIHIFKHVPDQTQPAGVSDGQKNIEWKSHIV